MIQDHFLMTGAGIITLLVAFVVFAFFCRLFCLFRLQKQDRERFKTVHKLLKNDLFNMWRERPSRTHFIAQNFDGYKQILQDYKEATGHPNRKFHTLDFKDAEKKFVDNLSKLIKHVELNSFTDHQRNKDLRAFGSDFMFQDTHRIEKSPEVRSENLTKILDKLDQFDQAILQAKEEINEAGKYYFDTLYKELTTPKPEYRGFLTALALDKRRVPLKSAPINPVNKTPVDLHLADKETVKNDPPALSLRPDHRRSVLAGADKEDDFFNQERD